MTYIADTFNDQSVAPLGTFKAALQEGRAATAKRINEARPTYDRLLREIDGVTRRDFGLLQQVAEELRGCGFSDATVAFSNFCLPTTAYGNITRSATLQIDDLAAAFRYFTRLPGPFLGGITFQAFYRVTDGSLIHYEVEKPPGWLSIPTIVYESSRQEVFREVVRQIGQCLAFHEIHTAGRGEGGR